MSQKVLVVGQDQHHRLMFPEDETTVQDLIAAVSDEFPHFPPLALNERIIIERPAASDRKGFHYVGMRPTAYFDENNRCLIPSYRSLAQIVEAATTFPDHDLSKIYLVVPDGEPWNLALHIKE